MSKNNIHLADQDAERIWKMARETLRSTITEAEYERCLRDTNGLAISGRAIIVAANTDYVCGWLQDNLGAEIPVVLAQVTDQVEQVRFVVEDQFQAELETESTGKAAVVRGAASTAYQDTVGSGSVVLSGYFLRLLEHGDIDAKALSLYVGFRQAVYFDWRNNGKKLPSVTSNIPHYAVNEFAMMARASMFREIGGRDSFADGLVERVPEPGQQDRRDLAHSNRYRVFMFPHLSRRDCTALRDYLAKDMEHVAPASVAKALTRILRHIADGDLSRYLNKTDPAHPVDEHCPRSVLEIVRQVAGLEGKLPPELVAAAEYLQDRVLAAFGRVVISHYFIQTVVPRLKLTHQQAWAVISLRDRSWFDYDTRMQKDFVIAPKGLASVASWVGVTEKAVSGWLEKPEFSLLVRMDDMRGSDIPADWKSDGTKVFWVQHLEPIWDATGNIQPGKNIGQQIDGQTRFASLGKSETRERKVETHNDDFGEPLEKVRLVREKLRLVDGKSETPLNNLIKPLIAIKTTTTSESFEKIETPLPMQKPVVVGQDFSSSSKPETAKPVDEKWDLNSILGSCGVSAKKRRELLATQVNPSAFVSWIIYGFSNRAQGLNDPVGNAIQNVLAGGAGAGGVCDRLAAYGSEKLIRLLTENLHNPASSSERAFAGFSFENKQELYLRLGGIAEDMPARKPAPRPAPLSATAQSIAAIPSQPPPELEARAREIFRRSQ